MALAEQQPHTGGMHDSLLHGETLLVVAAGDFEDIACEFGSKGVAGHFLTHAAVDEDAEFTLVVDFDQLLSTVGGV